MAFRPYTQANVDANQPIAPTTNIQPIKKPNLGERVADIWKQSGQKFTESVARGAERFENAGDGSTVQSQVKKTGALLESGLGTSAAVARGVFAPFEATAGAVGEAVGLDKWIQSMASSPELKPAISGLTKWAQENPDAARNLSDAITVAGTAVADVGGIKNPLNTDVSKIPGALGTALDDVGNQGTQMFARFNKTGTPTKIPKDIEFARKFTAPKLTTKEAEEAIKTGRATEPGLFRKSEVVPTAHDNLVAESVADVVSPNKSVVKNIEAINQKMSQINNGVRNMIADRKVPFNMKQLRSRLLDASDESKLVFASDATAERTYRAVVDEFLTHVKDGDTLGLFEARQNFDRVPAIRKLLETERLGENVRRQIVLDVRRAANEYIAEQLPKTNPYRSALMTESRMFEALGNIGAQNASTLGMNNIQILTKKYPLIKWLVGGIATGAAVGGSVGAGSTIIGSTD